MGWERPSWFTRSPDGHYHLYHHHYTLTECREFVGTFGKPYWFDNVCEEHKNCRNKVCVFDMTSFTKFEVEVSRLTFLYYGVHCIREYRNILG